MQSEGTSFAQRGGKSNEKSGTGGGKDKNDGYDKTYWADKDCYNCGQKGHPASQCPSKDKKNDDDRSKTSSAKSVKKLSKDFKHMKKKMTTINAQLSRLNEDSDLSDSDDAEETSHFQADPTAFQFVQEGFQPAIEKLFKQDQETDPTNLDLRWVILLDSESTMDLFCNKDLVDKVWKSEDKMKLRSNGGIMHQVLVL